MAKVKHTISFPPQDKELIRFVEKKKGMTNFSRYVRDLIRQDMNNEDIFLTPEQIYNYVIERLQKEGITMNEVAKTESNNLVDEKDKNVIMDLF